jgi:DNA-binding CsgD family transcriptional regulator
MINVHSISLFEVVEMTAPDHQQALRFYVNLTSRQREVVRLVSAGLTNREIADRLCIAPSVVAGHLTNIYGILANHYMHGSNLTSKRYTLIRLFNGFFELHDELD